MKVTLYDGFAFKHTDDGLENLAAHIFATSKTNITMEAAREMALEEQTIENTNIEIPDNADTNVFVLIEYPSGVMQSFATIEEAYESEVWNNWKTLLYLSPRGQVFSHTGEDEFQFAILRPGYIESTIPDNKGRCAISCEGCIIEEYPIML